MIYFAPETNRRVVRQLHESLGAEGWLVVGASEHNRESYSAFGAVNASGAKFYQKMALPATEAPLPVVAAVPVPPKPVPAGVETLRELADRGDWESAAEYS